MRCNKTSCNHGWFLEDSCRKSVTLLISSDLCVVHKSLYQFSHGGKKKSYLCSILARHAAFLCLLQICPCFDYVSIAQKVFSHCKTNYGVPTSAICGNAPPPMPLRCVPLLFRRLLSGVLYPVEVCPCLNAGSRDQHDETGMLQLEKEYEAPFKWRKNKGIEILHYSYL